MQSNKKIGTLLRRLVVIIEEECEKNPDFSAKVHGLLEQKSEPVVRKPKQTNIDSTKEPMPNVLQELESKGEEEFRFWLRDLDLDLLKLIVKTNGFDAAKKSLRWKDKDKFIELITEQASAQLKRGSSFLPPRNPTLDV